MHGGINNSYFAVAEIEKMFDIFVRALDRGRKPLTDLIPDLHELRARPQTFLANAPIVIGPAPRWGRAIVIGVLLTVALVMLTGFGSWIIGWRAEGSSVAPMLLIAILVANVWIASRLMNARLTLGPEGVEVHGFFSTVACPWSLFSHPGSVTPVYVGHGTPGDKVPETSHIFLPIDSRFLTLIEKRRRGRTVRRGEMARNSFFRIANRQQAVLFDAFRVEITQLGRLIIDIGNLLGRSVVPPSGEEVSLPIAFRKGGWIQVPITRLAFPFVCCACGETTQGTQEYIAHDWAIHFGRFVYVPGGQKLSFQVPQCGDCQKKGQGHLAKTRTICCLAGAIFAAFGCAAYYFTGHQSFDLYWGGGGLTLVGAFVGYWLGNALGQDRVPPISTRRFSAANGTVELRFRETAFTTAFLAQFK